MSQGGEQRLAVAVSKWLSAHQRAGRLWYFKVHGGPYQRAGVWDYIVVVAGHAHAIELKNPDESNNLSPLQARMGEEMARVGMALLVSRSLAEVVEFIELSFDLYGIPYVRVAKPGG